MTLPPTWIAFLAQHIQAAHSTITPGPTSSSVSAALTQRVKALQDENEQLYKVLRQSEVGRVYEEVEMLRRSVARLECALKGGRA